MRTKNHATIFAISFLLILFLSNISFSQNQEKQELPNILWIVSEDNSAYFTGCYGNSFATTPNIDQLANDGFIYTHAYCPNAVCAPTRNAILTGVYASSNGHENMRSTYDKSSIVRTYPEYLRELGYYCTNNSKTDYNTDSVDPNKIWDESSQTAHYKNRPDGKPFFAVFNSMTSHESCLFNQVPDEKLRHDPAKVTLPPYHPDTKAIRHDWAQYYDRVEDMDGWVGQLLKELDDSGQAENTIVFYYGDNGGVLPRSKRFIYETGTQIPLVVRIPEKYKKLYPSGKPGDKVDRLVNFVDLVPTLLSICGSEIPLHLQGHAFLGEKKTMDPEFAFMSRQRMDERYDNVRAVRDKQYRYIRNYMSFRITMQHVEFLWTAISAQSWEEEFRAGRTNETQSKYFKEKPVEELYDTENDPWEINNLVNDPKYADVLKRMRNALDQWRIDTKDAGVLCELDYKTLAGNMTIYDYMRSSLCPFDQLLKASDLAVLGNPKDLNTYIKYLQDQNVAIRYWGVTGIVRLKEAGRPAINALKGASNDEAVSVATMAAEALYNLGEKGLAVKTYKKLLSVKGNDLFARTFILNSIDGVNLDNPEIKRVVNQLISDLNAAYDKEVPPEKRPKMPSFMPQGYAGDDMKMAKYLIKKWKS